MVNLSTLPKPDVLEALSFEAIVARQKATFQNLWEVVRLANPDLGLPDYDVDMLETDPAIIIIEAESYRELLLRSRVNDAARSNLLAFSTGNDLDNLAADHGVTRLSGESDKALRERVVLADQGRSTAGPEEWYAFHARSVSSDVRDVKVYRPGTGPEIRIAVLSISNSGVPSSPLLASVLAKVTSPAIRSINDIVSVTAAVSLTVNVAAEIWLQPEAPISVFDGLEATLRAAAEAEGGIGFDINMSWLIARLSVGGVSKVRLTHPVADVVVGDFTAAKLGTVALTLAGRSR